jgi:nitrogen fixation protein NifZ
VSAADAGQPEIEIDGPPRFQPGDKVSARLNVKNDGTFAGRDIGERLVTIGDVGYVRDVGTFLQQFYIYAVDFVDTGHRVGMRGKELEAFVDTPATMPDSVSGEAA